MSNMTTKWFAVIAALNLVFELSARAEIEVAGDAGTETGVEVSTTIEKPARPEKPDRPERPKKEIAGQDVKELVTEFRTRMAEFHSEQKELVKKFKTASEEERAGIREQLKLNREEFHAVKEQFRDTVKDVTGDLKDHAAKVSAEVKSDTKGGKIRK
jgi:hypothetical protein